MERKAQAGQGCLIGGSIVTCVLVLVVGGIMGIVENRENKKLPGVAELEPHLAEYAQAGVEALAASSQPTSGAPLGKVVPVDVSDPDSPKLDFDVLKLLPEANRPLTDADVGTIALTRYFEKEIPAYYDAGEPGYADACEITIVDRASGALVRRGEVAGTPPSIIAEGQHSAGPLHPTQVLAFVLGQAE